MRLFGLFILFLGFSFPMASAQVTETKEGYNQLYKKRIKKEYLNNIYIPRDLKDAFTELRRLSDKKGLAKFKAADEDVVIKKLYFSLGRWVIVNWGFYGGSRLSHHLKTKLGVSHPEDQSIFILRAFHRSLNKKDLKLKEMSKELRDKRFNDRKAAADKIIKKEKRKRSK